jgi:hypothetical protein
MLKMAQNLQADSKKAQASNELNSKSSSQNLLSSSWLKLARLKIL